MIDRVGRYERARIVVRPVVACVLVLLSTLRARRARSWERFIVYRWAAGGPSFLHGRSNAADRLVMRLVERADRANPSVAVGIRVRALYQYAYEFLTSPKVTEPPFSHDASLVWFLFQYPILPSGPSSERIGEYYLGLFDHLGTVWEEDLGTDLRNSLAVSISTSFAFLPLLFTDHNTNVAASAAARWTEHYLRSSGAELDLPLAEVPRRTVEGAARIRVGVVVRNASPRTETYIATSFAALPKDRYEVILISFAALGTDTFSECVRSRFDRTEIVDTPFLAQRVARLRELRLDVVIHANTISAHSSDLLHTMAHRVAPLQILPAAIAPTTTGLRNMDVVLTSRATEPASPSDQYSERVTVLANTFQCFDFAGNEVWRLSGTALDEASTTWMSAAQRVFVVGGSLYKLTPEFRSAVVRILQGVPGSRLILYPFNPNWGLRESNRWRTELEDSFADRGLGPERIRVMPTLTPSQIVTLLGTSHVFLDTFPYSGAASLIDPLALGCPPVVLAGTAQRGLQGASILSEVGGQSCIATCDDEYVSIATTLGSDEAARQEMATLFRERLGSSAVLDLEQYGRDLDRAIRPLICQSTRRTDLP